MRIAGRANGSRGHLGIVLLDTVFFFLLLRQLCYRHDLIVFVQLNDTNSLCDPSHRPDSANTKSAQHPLGGDHHELVFFSDDVHPYDHDWGIGKRPAVGMSWNAAQK